MNYITTINNESFYLDNEMMNKEINLMRMMYQLKNSNSYFSLILIDNKELIDKIIHDLKEYIPNLNVYDKKTVFDINSFNESVKILPTAICDLDDYYENISNEKNISQDKIKRLFYESLNMCRDSLFIRYNSTIFIFLNNEEYQIFMNSAPDLYSYIQCKLNFNKCFVNNDGITLDAYYKDNYLKNIFEKEPAKDIKKLKKNNNKI